MERAQHGRARQSQHKLEARTQRCIKVRGTSLYRRRDRRPHWPRPAHGRSLEAELHTVGLRKKKLRFASRLLLRRVASRRTPNTVLPLRGNTGMVNRPAEEHSAESCLSNLSLAREGPTGRVPPLSSSVSRVPLVTPRRRFALPRLTVEDCVVAQAVMINR